MANAINLLASQSRPCLLYTSHQEYREYLSICADGKQYSDLNATHLVKIHLPSKIITSFELYIAPELKFTMFWVFTLWFMEIKQVLKVRDHKTDIQVTREMLLEYEQVLAV